MNDIARVAVLGTGVLGSQIAFQIAYSGFPVTAYDIDEAALAGARKRFDKLADTYRSEVEGASDAKVSEARSRLTLSSDLAEAAKDVDLVIEAVPELLAIKQATFEKLAAVAAQHTIFATNSSTLLPSDIAGFTGRPDRFLALHFANQIWRFNTAEIMGTPETDPAVFEQVAQFAERIGMVPIRIHKEKAGYVLNSLLGPFLNAALDLAAGDYARPEDIDRTWRIATGAPTGPFQMYDVIGLTTPYNILVNGDAREQELAAWLKKNYIDRGHLGVATGEGFYRYS